MSVARLHSRLRFGEFLNAKSLKNHLNSNARIPRFSYMNGSLHQNRKKSSSVGKYPSIENSKSLPLSYHSMNNENLTILASLDIEEATEEVLKRHIMSVDSIEYKEAEEVFDEISKANNERNLLNALPYNLGIMTAMVTGFASFPLCFHAPTVLWFNEKFVTTGIPSPEDLETVLEVGSWSWNWMEPPLGQISFFILCLQYIRNQMNNLGAKPFTSYLKNRKASALAAQFPKYDDRVLKQYSLSTSFLDFK